MKYNNKNIIITYANVYGIRKPMLQLEGIIKSKNFDFKVLINNEEVDFDLTYGENEDEETTILIRTGEIKYLKFKVKIYIINNKKEELIYSKNNSTKDRVKIKIMKSQNTIVRRFFNIFTSLYKGIKLAWREYHFLIPPTMWKKYFLAFIEKMKGNGNNNFYKPFVKEEYHKWIIENEREEEIIEFNYNPLISVIIPVYNVAGLYLRECLDSVLNQTYKNFEICIADDCSTKEETIKVLKEYESKYTNIKVVYRKENGHISKASNSAVDISKGEFIALLDNDDVITPNALYEMVKVLNNNKSIDMIYSDEDKLNLKGNRCDPNFKPNWSPDTLMSQNYICHFTLLRKTIFDEIGGFSVGLEGAQDYDLFLRFTEKTNNIFHLPKILYHWRMIEGSTSISGKFKNYAYEKGKIALENTLKRRNIDGIVKEEINSGYYITEYFYKKEPKISIIIPTRDYADILETCLKSIYQKTTYKNYEILIMNNNSVKEETFELFDKYKKEHSNFKVIDVNTEFNYSYINNLGVEKSTGKYLMLLNNDTEILTSNWLEIMVGYAMQKHIGAVGPKLVYPDKKIQHAGVVLGLGGVASHVYIGASKNDTGMYGRLKVPHNYSAVTAACLMVSKDKYLEVGGLEEELKVAYNDMDFNIKLLKKGYYNLFVPQVELTHYESKSRGLDTTTEKYKRFLLESDYMYKKWNKEIKNDNFYNINFSKKGWFVLEKKSKKKLDNFYKSFDKKDK